MNTLPYPTLWRADSDRTNYQAPKRKSERIKTNETKKAAEREVAKIFFDRKPSNNIFFSVLENFCKKRHTPPSDPKGGQMVDEA